MKGSLLVVSGPSGSGKTSLKTFFHSHLVQIPLKDSLSFQSPKSIVIVTFAFAFLSSSQFIFKIFPSVFS